MQTEVTVESENEAKEIKTHRRAMTIDQVKKIPIMNDHSKME